MKLFRSVLYLLLAVAGASPVALSQSQSASDLLQSATTAVEHGLEREKVSLIAALQEFRQASETIQRAVSIYPADPAVRQVERGEALVGGQTYTSLRSQVLVLEQYEELLTQPLRDLTWIEAEDRLATAQKLAIDVFNQRPDPLKPRSFSSWRRGPRVPLLPSEVKTVTQATRAFREAKSCDAARELVEPAFTILGSKGYTTEVEQLVENVLKHFSETDSQGQSISCYLSLARQLHGLRQTEAVEKVLVQALVRGHARSGAKGQIEAIALVATTWGQVGNRTRGKALLDDMLPVVRDISNAMVNATASLDLALAYADLGARDESRALLDDTVYRLAVLPPREPKILLLKRLAVAHAKIDEPDQVKEVLRKAVEIVTTLESDEKRGLWFVALSEPAFAVKDRELGFSMLHSARGTIEKREPGNTRDTVLTAIARAFADQGEFDAARSLLTQLSTSKARGVTQQYIEAKANPAANPGTEHASLTREVQLLKDQQFRIAALTALAENDASRAVEEAARIKTPIMNALIIRDIIDYHLKKGQRREALAAAKQFPQPDPESSNEAMLIKAAALVELALSMESGNQTHSLLLAEAAKDASHFDAARWLQDQQRSALSDSPAPVVSKLVDRLKRFGLVSPEGRGPILVSLLLLEEDKCIEAAELSRQVKDMFQRLLTLGQIADKCAAEKRSLSVVDARTLRGVLATL
ncbi:MAG: hypothetical protein KDD44_00470 [Bdellovibrionales bacterium]|nr:hypothetical protein [Bdellovibrionales bacterium]